MSIASEFDSTIENIKSDYEGLENIGADLTNVNKNIQNIRTCLDNIYTNLPKTTGEGSNLSLTTLKGRINVDDIKGDTEQDSTTGYNILNFNSYVALEDNMLSTNAGTGQILASDIQLQANTTYYFKFILLKKPIAQTTLTSYIDGTPDTTITQGNIQGGTIGELVTKQITPTSNCVLSIAIWGNANTETIKFQYWVTTDNTKNTFEPYTNGASPNPTYPQDINVVTGTQEVVVQNRNLFNKNTITENQRLDPSGNKNYDENCDLSDYIKIQPNTTYTRNITASVYECIAFYTSEKVFISRDTTHSTTTSPSNAYYVRISCYKTNLDTLQFELGSTASSYVEHQEQTKTLHLGDIELAKIDTYQDRIFETSGKNLFGGTLYNGQVGSNGGWTSGANRITNISANGVLSDFYLEQGTYTISIPKLDTCSLLTKDASGTILDNYATQWNNLPFTFTLTQAGYVSFTGRKTDNSNISPSDYVVMINKGSTTLPYEPYGSDKWYIEKNIGKVVLNGSETGWGTQNDVFCIEINDILTQSYDERSIIVLSNYFLGAITAYRGGINNLTIAKTIDKGKPKQLGIRYDAFNNVVADFKTWLSTHNTNVYYVLATPTYEEITNETLLNELNELEKIMSYNGQTNISVSGNLPMLLSVSALKGE